MRTLPLGLAALLVFAPVTDVGFAADADWPAIEKAFKKEFQPDKATLAKRKELVQRVVKSADGRGVKLLVGEMRDQRKHARDLREDWAKGLEAWQEKTARLEKQREERIRRIVEKAKAKGEKPSVPVDLTSEEGKWLGAPPKYVGEMVKAREKLARQYEQVLAEEALLGAMRQAVARILRKVEGEEFDRAVKIAIQAAERAKDDEQPALVAMLGYVPGDAVTESLVEFTESRDFATLQAALAALGRQYTERGKQVLLGFLDHEAWQVRSAALDGLAFFHDPEVMDRLLQRAAREEGVVRRRVFQTMCSIVEERVKAVLEAWQSWWPANREDKIEAWKRLPRRGPVMEDPPRFPIEVEGSGESTSFYGIKTDSKHIIFVADISGSMRRRDEDPADQPAKIDVCRDELKRAIRGLSARDEDERGAATFNVVLFSTDVLVYKEGRMIAATKKSKEKVFKWIDEKVQADMQTNLFGGLEQAFHIISSRSDKKNLERGADTIFLMTDGAPSRGKFVRPAVILQEVRKMNQGRDITIHTIGVGEQHNKGFLQRLAAENGGQYLAR